MDRGLGPGCSNAMRSRRDVTRRSHLTTAVPKVGQWYSSARRLCCSYDRAGSITLKRASDDSGNERCGYSKLTSAANRISAQGATTNCANSRYNINNNKYTNKQFTFCLRRHNTTKNSAKDTL